MVDYSLLHSLLLNLTYMAAQAAHGQQHVRTLNLFFESRPSARCRRVATRSRNSLQTCSVYVARFGQCKQTAQEILDLVNECNEVEAEQPREVSTSRNGSLDLDSFS